MSLRLFHGKNISGVKNLGLIFDSKHKFYQQINAFVKNISFHLISISKLKSILSVDDLEKVAHAFVSSCLDYFNALYLCVSQVSLSLSRLQLVQNSAARLLTCTKNREHITSALLKLHWLLVQYRIYYKMLLYVFEALHGSAPEYISDLISLHQSNRSLCSID